jgi:hypothetical protein
VGQEVRVKVIKTDPIEKKIGLSIKAALGEPDTTSVQAYFDGQGGAGGATLGDLVDPAMFKKTDGELSGDPSIEETVAIEDETTQVAEPAPETDEATVEATAEVETAEAAAPVSETPDEPKVDTDAETEAEAEAETDESDEKDKKADS